MLTEAIEELKKDIAEAEKRESGEAEQPEKEEEEKAPEKEADEPAKEAEPEKKEEAKPAEEKKEDAPAAEEKLDNAGYARLRRETAAAVRRAEEAETKRVAAETRLAELQNPVTEEEGHAPAVADPEMDEVRQKLRRDKAMTEFQTLEQKYLSRNPEYADVSKEYGIALAQSIRLQNPRMSQSEIAEKTIEAILVKAGNFMKNGYDPIEEMHHEAKDLGFTGKALKREEPAKETEDKGEEEIRPDMKKLAANRAKSTGMTGSTGKSEGQLTKAAAADLSVGEWAKLPAAEKRRLLYG